MIDRIVGGDGEAEERFTALEPVGRIGSSAEVAQAVVWLCSDAAVFVTGVAMAVDGGLVAQEHAGVWRRPGRHHASQ